MSVFFFAFSSLRGRGGRGEVLGWLMRGGFRYLDWDGVCAGGDRALCAVEDYLMGLGEGRAGEMAFVELGYEVWTGLVVDGISYMARLFFHTFSLHLVGIGTAGL